MKRGFTIIELLIVVSTLAILIGVGIASYKKNVERQKSNTEVKASKVDTTPGYEMLKPEAELITCPQCGRKFNK